MLLSILLDAPTVTVSTWLKVLKALALLELWLQPWRAAIWVLGNEPRVESMLAALAIPCQPDTKESLEKGDPDGGIASIRLSCGNDCGSSEELASGH